MWEWMAEEYIYECFKNDANQPSFPQAYTWKMKFSSMTVKIWVIIIKR